MSVGGSLDLVNDELNVSSQPQDSTPQPSDEQKRRAAALEELVDAWVSIPELAEMQGLRLNDVRRQLKDGDLVGVRRTESNAIYVPARFLVDNAPAPRLKGTVTVLRDGGMSDEELLEWLFTPDATLPGGGSAMDAFDAGFVTEVRRRAMESAL